MRSEDLTKRETEIITLVSKGLSNKEISKKLCISLITVQTHTINIMGKFGISDGTQKDKNVKRLRMALFYLKQHKELLEDNQ